MATAILSVTARKSSGLCSTFVFPTHRCRQVRQRENASETAPSKGLSDGVAGWRERVRDLSIAVAGG